MKSEIAKMVQAKPDLYSATAQPIYNNKEVLKENNENDENTPDVIVVPLIPREVPLMP